MAIDHDERDAAIPSIRLRQPGVLVYLCGIATSVATIFAVYLANRNGVHVMSWFVNFILPVGAILVGVASGLGYAIGSRLLHVKLSDRFLMLMFATGIVNYFIVQYITYLSLVSDVGPGLDRFSFLDYMRLISENMSFRSSRSAPNAAAPPLGFWGYGFQLLIVAGFAIGAVAPSLLVAGLDYCHRCQTYLTIHRSRYLNSSEKWSSVKSLAKAERKTALEAIVGDIANRTQHLMYEWSQAPFAETDAALERLDLTQAADAAAAVAITLKKCPHCEAHILSASLTTYNADKQVATAELGRLDKTQMLKPRSATDTIADESTGPPPLPNDEGAFRESKETP
jgi:hypothetical protein